MPTYLVDPKDWYPQQMPSEFERLIKDKTESFRGSKFVFDAIEKFFSTNPNGYFTVVGDARFHSCPVFQAPDLPRGWKTGEQP
ncbi:MAG: hypothetical protein KME38_01555 [Spirirestis rafaelensis WJT71-NPBG6]|nr:hypothetical protein [Spirirestis rafaelensis WJT71-NPBG6]